MLVKNIFIILLTLVSLLILGGGVGFFVFKLFGILEKAGKTVALHLKSKYWIKIIDVLYLLFMTVFLFTSVNILNIHKEEWIIIIFMLYAIGLVFFNSIINELYKSNPDYTNLLQLISHKINHNNYFVDRVFLFFNQFLDMFFLIAAIRLTLIFITYLKWSSEVYFVSLVIIPIYISIWVYCTIEFDLKSKLKIRLKLHLTPKMIAIRKIILYFWILVFIVSDLYHKFSFFLYNNKLPSFDGYTLVYFSILIYFAMERLIKELIADYKYFKDNID